MQTDEERFAAQLVETFTAHGLSLSAEQICQFVICARELREWNRRFNLTRLTSDREIIEGHYLDSLCSLGWMPESGRLLDIGSGAGFPGVPLAILRPDLKIVLLESVGKKARYLRHLTKTLRLDDTVVVEARAEQIAQDPLHRERYDRVLTRYVALLGKSVIYALRLVRREGLFIAYKGSDVQAELDEIRPRLEKHGGTVRAVEPINPRRTLVIIQKE